MICFSGNLFSQTNDKIGTDVAVLEKNGEHVDLRYTLRVNKGMFANCESVFYYLFLKNGEQVVEFPTVAIHGKARRNSFNRWIALHGNRSGSGEQPLTIFADRAGIENIPYETQFPFEEWMEGAVLYGRTILWGCGDNTSETTVELARLEIPEPAPEPEETVAPDTLTVPVPTPGKVYQKEGSAFIEFAVGKSDLDLNLGANQKEFSKIGDLIKEISQIPNAVITGLEITGFASPDGSYRLNEQLSRERVNTLSRYINTFFKLDLSPDQIRVHNVAEDWDGLYRLIEYSDIPQRDEILRIIRGSLSPDEKEQQLMKLSGGSVYRILLERYFPKLRRAEYKIMYQITE